MGEHIHLKSPAALRDVGPARGDSEKGLSRLPQGKANWDPKQKR